MEMGPVQRALQIETAEMALALDKLRTKIQEALSSFALRRTL